MARRARSLRLGAYLRHILDAIARIREYTVSLTEDDFQQSPMIQDAVVRNLEVIGEACRNVMNYHPEYAATHDEVPWYAPYEMRNALTHGYFSIDLVQVRATIQGDLPAFSTQISALLTQLDNDHSSQSAS
jgi:uncharacterized protein with HEPN domain